MENTLSSKPDTRPEAVETILSSLDRYNPENIKVLQDYVSQQAQDGTSDIGANLALLKLYQFNVANTKDDFVLMILTKALVRFYSADFSAAMHLLPAYVTAANLEAEVPLKEHVDKLFELYKLLDACKYAEFWSKFEHEDSPYADLVADVRGFEDDLRLSIAKTVQVSCKQISTAVFKEWVNIGSESKFKAWVQETLGWSFVQAKGGESVQVPLNKDNDAKPVITAETVRFDQLGKLIKHAYELSV